MNSFVNYSSLNTEQKIQYSDAISKAFPRIMSESQVIKRNWHKVEKYFPEYQQFLISPNGQIIGFINALPFYFDKPLNELPDKGWDWMIEKGITDWENKVMPNYLGGLQVIVRAAYKRQGYSRIILNQAKQILASTRLQRLVIPIRPIKKHEFPKMPMSTYIHLKEQNKIFDPWIRRHVECGAQIIKVCEHSMTVQGDLEFWKTIMKRKIETSGEFPLERALSLIKIDVENNIGQYIEPNIWISYN